jgi:hypothetical protein
MKPNLAAVFILVALVGCGGGGGGGDSSPAPALAASKIFLGDRGHGLIGSAVNTNPSAGTTAIADRVISGGSTLLTSSVLGVRDFGLDAANDRLFVSDSDHVLAFDHISTANGSVAPRVVAAATGGDTFSGIFIDTMHDRVYATVRLNTAGNEVRVYEAAGTVTSAATPSRTFSFPSTLIYDIAVDTVIDVAYVYYVAGSAHIAVLANASTLNGPLALTQVIDYGTIRPNDSEPLGIFLTPQGHLYVPNIDLTLGPTIEVFHVPSTASGVHAPNRTITLPPGVPQAFTNIFVDISTNRLYAADFFGLSIAQNASLITSMTGAVRVISGPSSGTSFTAVAVKPI